MSNENSASALATWPGFKPPQDAETIAAYNRYFKRCYTKHKRGPAPDYAVPDEWCYPLIAYMAEHEHLPPAGEEMRKYVEFDAQDTPVFQSGEIGENVYLKSKFGYGGFVGFANASHAHQTIRKAAEEKGFINFRKRTVSRLDYFLTTAGKELYKNTILPALQSEITNPSPVIEETPKEKTKPDKILKTNPFAALKALAPEVYTQAEQAVRDDFFSQKPGYFKLIANMGRKLERLIETGALTDPTAQMFSIPDIGLTNKTVHRWYNHHLADGHKENPLIVKPKGSMYGVSHHALTHAGWEFYLNEIKPHLAVDNSLKQPKIAVSARKNPDDRIFLPKAATTTVTLKREVFMQPDDKTPPKASTQPDLDNDDDDNIEPSAQEKAAISRRIANARKNKSDTDRISQPAELFAALSGSDKKKPTITVEELKSIHQQWKQSRQSGPSK